MSGGGWIIPELCGNQTVGASTAASVPVSLTISTTSQNVKNAYTQLTAATSGDMQWIDVVIRSTVTMPINTTVYSDIAIGPAGNEVVLVPNISFGPGGTFTNFMGTRAAFPVGIPGGSRVAARFALSSSTTTTTTVGVQVQVEGYDIGMAGRPGFAGVDSVGQTNGVGTTLFTSTVANVKGPYAQLTAATTLDYAGFVLGFETGVLNPGCLVDVAVGSAGNEKNIVNNYFVQLFNGPVPVIGNTIMVPVPSGTRVAARMQAGSANTNLHITAYGIYA